MNRSKYPAQFSKRPSDTLAIFDGGVIVYATNSFETLYNNLKPTLRKKFDRQLRDLKQDLRKSAKTFAQKRMTLIRPDQAIEITVYLLNKSGSAKNGLLVMADSSKTGAE